MRTQFKRVSALALSCALMAMPVFAADETTQTAASGTITTDFGVYSPTVTVSVPLKASVQVNPLYDSNASDGDIQSFSVASKALIIANSTTDVDPTDSDKKVAVPVLVTAEATLTSAEGVVTYFYPDLLTPNDEAANKKIQLNLAQGTVTAGTTKKDTSDDTAAGFGASGVKKTPITVWGSKLQFKVDGPALDTNATDVDEFGLGAFAITGTAYTAADWQTSDVTVSLKYDIKASNQSGLPVGTVAAVSQKKGADAEFTISAADANEAKVISVGLHNNEENAYGDYVIPAESWKAEEQDDGSIKVTYLNTDVGVANLVENYAGEPQDFVIVMSDGRFIVTTLTYTES